MLDIRHPEGGSIEHLAPVRNALQVIRLQAEEKLLGQDPVYAEYMTKVPYRLAPGLY